MSRSAIEISVVVSCRYAGHLSRVLSALGRQVVDDGRFEVILVDSSENGDGARAVEAYPTRPPVTVERHEAGLTPGAARNRGVALSRGRFVTFLEADCVPHPDWLATRVAWHHRGYPAVAGAIDCAPPYSLAARVQWLTRFGGALPGGSPRRRKVPLYGWSYDRALLARPFREDLELGEDGEFNGRLLAEGVKVLFDPAIRVAHIGLPSLEAVRAHHFRHGAWAARLAAEGAAPWIRLHGSAGLPAWYPAWKWAGTLPRAARAGPGTLTWFLLLTPWTVPAFRASARGFCSATDSQLAGVR